MPIPHDLDAFRKNYLAHGLTGEQLKDLAGLAELKRFEARTTLISAGQRTADMYVILQGSVRVQMPDGDKLADIGPGAVLGEISLLDSQPRSANAICMTSVEAAYFDANSKIDMLTDSAEAWKNAL